MKTGDAGYTHNRGSSWYSSAQPASEAGFFAEYGSTLDFGSCAYLRDPEFFSKMRAAWLGSHGCLLDHFQNYPPALITWGSKHVLATDASLKTVSIYLPMVNVFEEIFRTLESGTYGYGTYSRPNQKLSVIRPYVWSTGTAPIGQTTIDGTRLVDLDKQNVIVLPYSSRMHSYSQPEGTFTNVIGLTAVYHASDYQHLPWASDRPSSEYWAEFLRTLAGKT
jgi:hypothetical protein